MSKVKQLPTFQRMATPQFVEEVTRNAQEHAASINELYDLRWDDLRSPAQALNTPGSIGTPGRNATDGLLDFDHNSTETIYAVWQLPHAWAETTTVRPHAHLLYRNAAAGNSVWTFSYKIANVNGDFQANYTDVTVTHTGPASTTQHVLVSFGDIDMTGYRDSCVILWKLARIGGNGSDTFGYDIGLIEADLHWQSDGRGSAQEYPA